ncbi:MAG TPA: allophanate hydrolase [Clostridiales bacterium UBA8153]|nr:allophanate hydrolase [Clostridiales bacterium UBA8153]
MVRLLEAGDAGLVVEYGDKVDPELHGRVLALYYRLAERALPGIRELVPTYRSLLVEYDPLVIGYQQLVETIEPLTAGPPRPCSGRLMEVPVCYGGERGPDLEEVAALCRLPVQEVIARHAAPTYLVYMLGFSPGFPYLGGLDPSLQVPRLARPRLQVPAGSVAIAGPQAGIYPQSTPGGWRIIGYTRLALFDPGSDAPFLLQAGDSVRFVPVKEGEHAHA